MSNLQPISGFQISEFGILLGLSAVPKESLDEHRFSLAVPATPSRIRCHGGHLPKANARCWFDGLFQGGGLERYGRGSLYKDEDEAERLISSGSADRSQQLPRSISSKVLRTATSQH